MIYKDRVILIQTKEVDDYLDKRLVKEESSPIPCMASPLTNQEQMGLFGQYRLDSFKLHLQGHYPNIAEIRYAGQLRKVAGVKHHRHSTVIYV